MNIISLAVLLLCAFAADAQLTVIASPPKVAGQKAVVPIAMKNGLPEKVESARAVCFALDNKGKVVGQSTQWIIGGTKGSPALGAGATNTFYFVITGDKPFTTTNLTAKVTLNRVVLEGGKSVDVSKTVSYGQ